MALQSPTRVYSAGDAIRVCLYLYKNVTAADTFNLNTDFTKIAFACMISGAGVSQNPAISALTTLTVAAGPSNEDGYLMVVGQTA